jgi:hypothetical protein
MSSRHITGISLAALFGAGAILISASAAEAAMSPPATDAASSIHRVDCAVGAHLGPLGACVFGEPDHDNGVVIERRSADEPRCRTKTVEETDGMGNTVRRSKTVCDR